MATNRFQSAFEYELNVFVSNVINREYSRLQEAGEHVAQFSIKHLADEFEDKYQYTPERRTLLRRMRVVVKRQVENNFRYYSIK